MRFCEISKEMSSLYFRLAVLCLFEARVPECDKQTPAHPVQCITVHWTLRQILGLQLQIGRIHQVQNTTTIPLCSSTNTSSLLLFLLTFLLNFHPCFSSIICYSIICWLNCAICSSQPKSTVRYPSCHIYCLLIHSFPVCVISSESACSRYTFVIMPKCSRMTHILTLCLPFLITHALWIFSFGQLAFFSPVSISFPYSSIF